MADIRTRVLGSNEPSNGYSYVFYLENSTWNKVLPHTLEIAFVGFVRFHDVFDNRYRQNFCFRYLVGSFNAETLEVDMDWFFAGPDKNNRYHRYNK